ncbi:MAG: DUF1109 domain-containing protein [Bdellovibrionota bacterium]
MTAEDKRKLKITTDELIDNLVVDNKPVTVLKDHRIRFIQWLLISTVSITIGLQLLGIRNDIGIKLQDPLFIIESFIIVFTAVLATSAAFTLSIPGLERSKSQKYGVYITLGLWFLITIIKIINSDLDLQQGLVGFSCITDTITLGIMPGILLFYMLRKAASVRLGLSGAMAFLGTLALAGIGIRFSCSFEHPVHLLIGHILPILTLGIVGIFIGKITLHWD